MQSALPLACFLSMIRPPGVQFENALLQIAPVDKAKCPFVRDHNDIGFRLYTRHNPTVYQELVIDDDEKLFASNLDYHAPTVLFFHAFMETTDDGSAAAVREAYMLRGDTNLIMVDASRLEAGPWYFTAAENTWYIGKFAARFIDYLVSRGLDLKNTHLVGHSLGAQAAGVAGSALKSGRVSRITGLDPALPLFHGLPDEQRLDKNDADFVDVIHTDAGIFGVSEPMGHADFYPNGGISPQPGCELEVVIPQHLLLNKCDKHITTLGTYTFDLTPYKTKSTNKLENSLQTLFNKMNSSTRGIENGFGQIKNDKKGRLFSSIRQEVIDDQDTVEIIQRYNQAVPYFVAIVNKEKHTTHDKQNNLMNDDISTRVTTLRNDTVTVNNTEIPLYKQIYKTAEVIDDQETVESIQRYNQAVPYFVAIVNKEKHTTHDKQNKLMKDNISTSVTTLKHDTETVNNTEIPLYKQIYKTAEPIDQINIATVVTVENIEDISKDIMTNKNLTETSRDAFFLNRETSHKTENFPGEILIKTNTDTVKREQNKTRLSNDEPLKLNTTANLEELSFKPVEGTTQYNEFDSKKHAQAQTIIDKKPITSFSNQKLIRKRQKRFINPFRKSEEEQQQNLLFRLLDFVFKHGRHIPIYSVMREINTLVKSGQGELNHVTKERNNFIGAPPPLVPVTYSLELGNESRAVAFVKRLLGFTPKGDRLTISGTGK